MESRGFVVDSKGYVHVYGNYHRYGNFSSFILITNDNDNVEAFLARWSPLPANDLIFADNFESGDFTAWTNYSWDLRDLSVEREAALQGRYGLEASLDDNNPIGMRDEYPAGEDRYLMRFRFDPRDFEMGQDENFVLFFGYNGSDLRRPVLRLELRYHGDSHQVRAALLDDSTTWRTSGWKNITYEPYRFTMVWNAATAPGANDGSLLFYVHDSLRALITGVDNDTRRIDTIRLGAIAGIDEGTRGIIDFDSFESRRLTYVDRNTMITASATDEITAWTEVAESDPEEAALMQEVLEYAEQVEQEEGRQELPPTDEEQVPQLFLPYLDNGS
jgi:hypothetical protein